MEWRGFVTNVRLAHVDDDTIAWGADQAGWNAHARAMARAPLKNAHFDVRVLQLTDRAFAVVAPIDGACWLTSLATTYGRAARDEVAREVNGAQALIFSALSHVAEATLRLTRCDRSVLANHMLFSTSLYGDWTGADLESALTNLRTAFPDRAIIWRSLNAVDHAPLIARMTALGGRRLLSRIVWRLTDSEREWAPRRDARDDRQLILDQKMRIETARAHSDDELRLVLRFYNDLYREKYSRTNPAYSETFLRAAINSGVLTLRAIRNEGGRLEGFAAEHAYQGTLINPLLGYDRTQPQSRGLYRIAMAASAERAITEGLKLNYSAGAGAFKRNRGAKPTLEFSMVFDDHLPAWRRAGYRALAWALEKMAPMLERIAVT
jgi:hypothetical protein